MTEIKSLLENIERLIKQSKEISRLKGENFNIFSILKLASNENKLHSRFLHELLNRNGSHGLGTTFLDLFVKYLKENICTELQFESEKSSIRVEKSIGLVNNKEKTGGRIDIFIKGGIGEIIIENKIYASEQEGQIERYCNYAKEHNAKVFYLTLYGAKSESNGKYELNKDYFCLSYSKDIINWLELCKKEVSDYPIIRETIKQYIIILKRLTGQLTNQAMTKEVKIQILNNYEAAKQIADSLNSIQKDILDFWKSVTSKIAKHPTVLSKNWKVEINDPNANPHNIILDVFRHGRGVLNVYMENIKDGNVFNGIYINKDRYNMNSVEEYINKKELKWNLSEKYILKEDLEFNSKKTTDFQKICNQIEREKLITDFSEKLVQFAVENEEHLKEINKFRLK